MKINNTFGKNILALKKFRKKIQTGKLLILRQLYFSKLRRKITIFFQLIIAFLGQKRDIFQLVIAFSGQKRDRFQLIIAFSKKRDIF